MTWFLFVPWAPTCHQVASIEMRIPQCLVPYWGHWVKNGMYMCEQGLEWWNTVILEGQVQKCHYSCGNGKHCKGNVIGGHLCRDTELIARGNLCASFWVLLGVFFMASSKILFCPVFSFFQRTRKGLPSEGTCFPCENYSVCTLFSFIYFPEKRQVVGLSASTS